MASGWDPQDRRLRRVARECRPRHRQRRPSELSGAATPLLGDTERDQQWRWRKLRALLRWARRPAARRCRRDTRHGEARVRLRAGPHHPERQGDRDMALRPRPIRRVPNTRWRISEQRLGRRDVERPGLVRSRLGGQCGAGGAEHAWDHRRPRTRRPAGRGVWRHDDTKAGGIKLKDGTILMPQIKSYDDQSATDRVQALYTKLINDDKVDFLLSPYSSGLVKAAAVVSEQNGKVMITAGGADDATMEQGFKYIYQVYTPASKYLTGAIDLIGKLDPSIKKIAIVNEKDSFSTSVVLAAKPYAESKGLQVVVNEGYDTGTTDFAPFINKIVAATPDAIIGGGHLPDGTTFAKQLYEKKVSARFVSLLVAPPEPTFADIGDAAQFIVGPSQWEPH